MKDDHAIDATPPRRTGLSEEMPVPKSRGLFRKAGTKGTALGLTASKTALAQTRTGTAIARASVNALAKPAKATVLPQWDDLRLMLPGVRKHILERSPLVNFFREDPVSKSFDLLRTRLLHTLRANGWHRIAIASPTSGCGSTFTAVNLALSLARVQGSRNVLLDLNHRKPGIATALDMHGIGPMREFLNGEVKMERHLVRVSKTLAVGLTTEPDRDAAELLHDMRCSITLDRMSTALHPDVVLCDLPPILEYDDLAAFLPKVDGVLLVSSATQTLPRHIAACERILEGNTRVLGVVLNQARRSGPDPVEV